MRFRAVALSIVALVLSTSPPPAHALRITELLASNDTILADEDGDFEDWLEVHNEGLVAVDLAGWYLTDDDALLTRWQFPSVSLPPGGYLLVWASNKDRTNPAAPLHTNFGLSAGGEYLALVQPDGTTIEHEYAPEFPEQRTDISFGLSGDLITERCFQVPTPGAANNVGQSCDFVEPVEFTVERGFYDAPILVELSTATPGATIHYTLDASDPSETHGTPYSVPIPITTTTALRAIAFKQDHVSTPSVTHTYIFLDDVLQQSIDNLPPEYPDSWTGGFSADYDMDPDVVTDPLYASTIKDDLKSIPTMSLVTDVDHLFGPDNGIYTHTGNRGIEWERPVSAELILPDGGDGFQVNCGVRIQGNISRLGWKRKHSLRLLFKSIYGPSTLNYPLFIDSDVDTIDPLTLTARSANAWHNGSSRALYLRDTFTKESQIAMGRPASHSAYVHLYLNGLYWGLYRPSERPSVTFLVQHFGGTEDDWDLLQGEDDGGIDVSDGDRVAWDTAVDLSREDLSIQANYDALLEYIDVDNLIDYLIVNMWVGNNDWNDHNWWAGRKREPGAGFKFFTWDAERTLEFINAGQTNANRGPSQFYDRLRRASQEFRVRFGDHVHMHFFNGGALTQEKATARLVRWAGVIDRAVVGESARWGDKSRNVPFTRDNEWLVAKNWVLLAFFPRRNAIVLEQFRDKDLYPDVDAPVFSQHGGSFFPGLQVTMTAPEGAIYFTDDGSDPRLTGGGVAPVAQLYSGAVTLTDGVHIAARALVGSSEWSALNAADFVRDTPLRITEIMYNPPGGSDLEFLELQNIGAAAVDLTGLTFVEGIDFVFPAGTLDPGQHVLIVNDLAAFDLFYGAGLPVAGEYSGNLSNGGEQLRLEDADGNVIHDFTYDDAWYPTTDGGGSSLSIRETQADVATWGEAAAWRASTFANGSAGSAEPRRCDDGVDNDNDGDTDLSDAGCPDATQDFEDPECNDGIDNDGDGAIDLADLHCGTAADNAEAATPVDPFVCYKVRENRDGPAFQPVGVNLSDAFESDITYVVRRPKDLCVPVSLNGAATIDDATYLESYQIREATSEPRHVPRILLPTENGFGPLFVDTRKVDRLLTPTAVETAPPVTAPAPGAHAVDHYKCYKAKMTPRTPKYFPSGKAEANADGEFEHHNYRLKKVRHLCAPVDTDGEGIKNSDGYLLCYAAKIAPGGGKHVRNIGLHTANQFGAGQLDTIKEIELCLPTRLTGMP